jgi:hypothetical protein
MTHVSNRTWHTSPKGLDTWVQKDMTHVSNRTWHTSPKGLTHESKRTWHMSQIGLDTWVQKDLTPESNRTWHMSPKGLDTRVQKELDWQESCRGGLEWQSNHCQTWWMLNSNIWKLKTLNQTHNGQVQNKQRSSS